jgi:hypothetical protein
MFGQVFSKFCYVSRQLFFTFFRSVSKSQEGTGLPVEPQLLEAYLTLNGDTVEKSTSCPQGACSVAD